MLPITGAVAEWSATELDPAAEALVEESRSRQLLPFSRRDRLTTWLIGGTFLAVAAPMALTLDSQRSPSVLTVALLTVAYALTSRVEFEVGSGSAVPTQLFLVPMLFLLPAPAVPLFVAIGYVLGHLPDHVRGQAPAERAVVLLGNSWHAVGPALVFSLAGEPAIALGNWPIFLGALATQFALDLASSTARERLAVGVSPRLLLRPMGWVFAVDALLAPVGLLAAYASARSAVVFLLILPLIGLLTIFARERQVRIDHALELSSAYRGTAFLLGDVVEADDAYTGSHSRDVVELVLAVADEVGLSARERRNAEFAALLHDVGKIRIPGEIINKAGPLTPGEREIVNTHTIEGQVLLERVGGLLGEVGAIVRSCHEHVDGSGYPDGLAGEEIPLIARIVGCCDAFNAMTTDRSYRKGMPVADALEELRRHAGTQFDSRVVATLVSISERA